MAGSETQQSIAQTIELDAYGPAQIAERVERAGVAKARLPLLQTLSLGALAGAFIAFGAMYFTVVTTDPGIGFGPTRLLGGLAFSLGLVMVVIAGAELFTGNSLMVMAWVDGRISGRELARNWTLVYLANFAGAVGAAVLLVLADGLALGGGKVLANATAIAQAKVAIGPVAGFFRGILCNALVCMAIWLALGAREVTGKILAIVFPISAFVALGFEHSIANIYFIVLGILLGIPGVDFGGLVANLVPVTLGNIVGGGAFVALTYWVCYRAPSG